MNKYFTRQEFKCKCGCGFDAVDKELLDVLTDVRKHFRKPVNINCACRCSEHNAEVGGKPKSQHLFGKAADIVVKNTDPHKVYSYLYDKYPNKYGIGSYNTFTHIDVRKQKARW